MMRWYAFLLSSLLSASLLATQSVKTLDKVNGKTNGTPCVQAFLNADLLQDGVFLSKKSKGIITVTKDKVNKIYFNVTLKSNIGKKDEPPIYLRFIKQKQLDISEILEYAEEGDEIYIEEFVPSLNKINLNCTPASIIVGSNL
ncbi:MAG TPA: hypothetical protein PLU78_00060 [Chitinophagales bacterium]|jgi:hypothetical protein|nr:hypothetical protein [Chitinophagales bacterium]